jgi:GNAT superfamily N-acetyltransferase
MDQRILAANSRLPPDLIDEYLWLQKCYKNSREKYVQHTTSVMRLLDLVRGNCKVARVKGWKSLENVWVWNDAVVFELEKAYWDDVSGSGNWLAYLRKMYVVDSKRGCGLGSKFIHTLQEWCEISGSAVCLVSLPFGFSRDAYSGGAYFFDKAADVVDLWEAGEFHPLIGIELLRSWYSERGFRNAFLLDGHFFSFSSEIDDDDQFIYVPGTLDDSAKPLASHRLRKREECLPESV